MYIIIAMNLIITKMIVNDSSMKQYSITFLINYNEFGENRSNKNKITKN